MTLLALVLLVLQASIWLMVVSLGLRTSLDDLTWLVRRPGLMARSLAAMFVAPPACALALNLAFDIPGPVRFAIVAMTVATVPPALPNKQAKVADHGHYVVGLLTTAALVSVVATPLLIALASKVLGVSAAAPPAQIVRTLLLSIGAPLAAGLAIRRIAPRAVAVSGVTNRIGMALLPAGAIVLLVAAWPSIAPLARDGALVAIVATLVAALAAGHLLGARDHVSGPLALAAANRHPGVAMAIAAASFPEARRDAAAGVLLFLLVNAVVSGAYIWWARRQANRPGAATAERPAASS